MMKHMQTIYFTYLTQGIILYPFGGVNEAAGRRKTMEGHFTVCIGRAYGSGGREVGELTAQKLGVTCYDKLLIQKTARESGMNEGFLEKNDETLTDSVILPFSGNCFADAADMGNLFYSAGDSAFEAEKKTIEEIAGKESSVMIGRCASSILAGKPGTLSVFLYADEESRIRRIAARNGLSHHAARERMEKVDRMRRRYFDFYSMTDWGKPESYDLMLSTSALGMEAAADMIVDLVQKRLGAASHE